MTALRNAELRDALKAWLESVGIHAWSCFHGPAACLGALDRGKFMLIEAVGRGMDSEQLAWKDRIIESGGVYLRAKSIDDLDRQLFGDPPWRLTPAEIDDAIASIPDCSFRSDEIPF